MEPSATRMALSIIPTNDKIANTSHKLRFTLFDTISHYKRVFEFKTS